VIVKGFTQFQTVAPHQCIRFKNQESTWKTYSALNDIYFDIFFPLVFKEKYWKLAVLQSAREI
jgi:hypothetical protein